MDVSSLFRPESKPKEPRGGLRSTQLHPIFEEHDDVLTARAQGLFFSIDLGQFGALDEQGKERQQ